MANINVIWKYLIQRICALNRNTLQTRKYLVLIKSYQSKQTNGLTDRQTDIKKCTLSVNLQLEVCGGGIKKT